MDTKTGNTTSPMPEVPVPILGQETQRKCLFCENRVKDGITNEDMSYKRKWYSGFYSNALMDNNWHEIVRFYVCKEHFNRIGEAWEWASSQARRRNNG